MPEQNILDTRSKISQSICTVQGTWMKKAWVNAGTATLPVEVHVLYVCDESIHWNHSQVMPTRPLESDPISSVIVVGVTYTYNTLLGMSV